MEKKAWKEEGRDGKGRMSSKEWKGKGRDWKRRHGKRRGGMEKEG